MDNLFDNMTSKDSEPTIDVDMTAGQEEADDVENIDDPVSSDSRSGDTTYSVTPNKVKAAIQELLKYGFVDASKKKEIFATILGKKSAINKVLEPLDLDLKIDEVRGLALLIINNDTYNDEDDEWSHPLVRRQRLTLEQSLMVAILRQAYITHEQEVGVGVSDAVVDIDDVIPQLLIYFGDCGSDAKEQKRARALLEGLKNHAVVSDINEKDQFTIKPIITHLANPESLTNLLQHFKEASANNEKITEGDD